MKITLEQAQRLFKEANDFTLNRQPYMNDESEIRKIANETFHSNNLTSLYHVCSEIFRILACEFMDIPSN